ncbi:hypothetical protein PR048_001349 [Dryococelus australis]|uniref:PPM-type phosphatase domain-containing protein n=1 Tax=Dryococelus australis TaxID=614101 RepID=A0ABQ9IH46_9NEOP|nr:hypothetical protein PR048_001349 [Dryococelus australis]
MSSPDTTKALTEGFAGQSYSATVDRRECTGHAQELQGDFATTCYGGVKEKTWVKGGSGLGRRSYLWRVLQKLLVELGGGGTMHSLSPWVEADDRFTTSARGSAAVTSVGTGVLRSCGERWTEHGSLKLLPDRNPQVVSFSAVVPAPFWPCKSAVAKYGTPRVTDSPGGGVSSALGIHRILPAWQSFGGLLIFEYLAGCVFVANCGDSRALLCRDGKPVFATCDHKPVLPAEKERIIRAGGSVMIQRVNGSLAVSRALGDYEYKNVEGRGPCEQLVSPEPEVSVMDWDEDRDEFLVLACDGVWDVMTNEDLCSFVRSRLAISNDLESIANQVIDTCLYKVIYVTSYGLFGICSVAFHSLPQCVGGPLNTSEGLLALNSLVLFIRNEQSAGSLSGRYCSAYSVVRQVTVEDQLVFCGLGTEYLTCVADDEGKECMGCKHLESWVVDRLPATARCNHKRRAFNSLQLSLPTPWLAAPVRDTAGVGCPLRCNKHVTLCYLLSDRGELKGEQSILAGQRFCFVPCRRCLASPGGGRVVGSQRTVEPVVGSGGHAAEMRNLQAGRRPWVSLALSGGRPSLPLGLVTWLC